MTSSRGLQTNTRRLELYIGVSLYILLALTPLLVVNASPPGSVWLAPLVALVQATTNIVVCRWALRHMRHLPVRPDRRTRRLLVAWAAFNAAVVVAAVVTVDVGSGWLIVLIVVIGSPLGSISPVLRARTVGTAMGLAVVLYGICASAELDWDLANTFGLVLGLGLGLVLVVGTFWLSGWMLRVVQELDEARKGAAQLAIAEERLRISRDLHDLFGRTLATVAVKSELAAELIRRGQPDPAAEEIRAVRTIADDAGREIRLVVRGFRQSGLMVELEGARSLLDSAGVRCVVHGQVPDDLDPQLASVFGWILREAVTNVIRHSQATECFIALSTGDHVQLTVTNNGTVPVSEPHPGGTGLVGMAERLQAYEGTLAHHQSQDRFTVEATAPGRRAAARSAR